MKEVRERGNGNRRDEAPDYPLRIASFRAETDEVEGLRGKKTRDDQPKGIGDLVGVDQHRA